MNPQQREMLSVNSAVLEKAANEIRWRKSGPQEIPALGHTVSAAQMDAAAALLRDAEPSIITHVSGRITGSFSSEPQERPGYIHPEQQDDPEVLVLTVGVICADTYRIDRKGRVL